MPHLLPKQKGWHNAYKHTHTHTRLLALCPGLPGWAGTRKVKPIWILLKQETVSGSGISWAICKSAPRSRQIATPAPHRSSFVQAGCPSCRPTNSVKALKAHWQCIECQSILWLCETYRSLLLIITKSVSLVPTLSFILPSWRVSLRARLHSMRGRVYATIERPSVCPFVPSIDCSGGFAAEFRAISRYR